MYPTPITTRTFVWIDDQGWTTCAKHALPSLVDQFTRAEAARESIVWNVHGSWMRVFADDAEKIGLACFYCNHS